MSFSYFTDNLCDEGSEGRGHILLPSLSIMDWLSRHFRKFHERFSSRQT